MNKPICTTLSHSGGAQSQWILELVLLGLLPVTTDFLVTNANPGMENIETYLYVARMKERCAKAGIRYVTAEGPNLWLDGTQGKAQGMNHFNTPPLWTKNRITGKKGRLRQKCTGFYKIQPMRRALRQHLNERHGVSLKTKRIPQVETWIGFASDEAHRCSDSDVKYVTNRYPLIELGLTKAQITTAYLTKGIPKPPMSVCNACYANGLAYFKAMSDDRPDDFEKACQFDDSIRDLRCYGIEDECFVSATLIPLRELEQMDFNVGEKQREYQCNSGVCFL